jgi:hypothetical protein
LAVAAYVEQGLPVTAKTLSCVIDEYVAARHKSYTQGKTSAAMLRQVKRVVKFWKEYAGSKPIHSVCDADLRNYVEWRRDYYANSLKPIPCNAKMNPADKTLQWEIMLGKAIIKWALFDGCPMTDASVRFATPADFVWLHGEIPLWSVCPIERSLRIASQVSEHQVDAQLGERLCCVRWRGVIA